MKNSVAAFVVFLVAVVLLSQTQAQFGPSVCCFKYQAKAIPLRYLKSFEYSNARCALPAIIFTTKKNIPICGDPSESWVQDRVKHLTTN